MFEPVKIAPSILSADFMNMESEIRRLEKAGADWIHVDVMDGHFVPNLTMGVPIVKQLRSLTALPLDVHLMISNPLDQLPWFLEADPDMVTVHWEALDESQNEAQKALELIHAAGSQAALTIKPDAPVSVLAPYIEHLEMVLIMSVFPGFSGQSFIEGSDARVAEVVRMAREKGVSPLIQVDGGIGEKTAPLVAAAGADVLVAGNAVFKADKLSVAIENIRNIATQAQP